MSNVIIKWDEAVSKPANYQVIRYRKSAPTDKVEFTPVASGQAHYIFEDTQMGNAYDNKLWVYRVQSLCGDGSKPFAFAEYIRFGCDLTFTYESTFDSVSFQFFHPISDVDRYTIKLYDGVTAVGTVEKNAPFTNPITGSFTGLLPNKDYTLEIQSSIVGTSFSDICDYDVKTKLKYEYTITGNPGANVSYVQLEVGNNGNSPSGGPVTYVPYTDEPISGNSSFIPDGVGVTNANIRFTAHSGVMLSATCNGQVGTISGNTVNWTSVTGPSVDIEFTMQVATLTRVGTCNGEKTTFNLTGTNGEIVGLKLLVEDRLLYDGAGAGSRIEIALIVNGVATTANSPYSTTDTDHSISANASATIPATIETTIHIKDSLSPSPTSVLSIQPATSGQTNLCWGMD